MKEHRLAYTLIADICPHPQTCKIIKGLFSATKFVAICYSSGQKLIQFRNMNSGPQLLPAGGCCASGQSPPFLGLQNRQNKQGWWDKALRLGLTEPFASFPRIPVFDITMP